MGVFSTELFIFNIFEIFYKILQIFEILGIGIYLTISSFNFAS